MGVLRGRPPLHRLHLLPCATWLLPVLIGSGGTQVFLARNVLPGPLSMLSLPLTSTKTLSWHTPESYTQLTMNMNEACLEGITPIGCFSHYT